MDCLADSRGRNKEAEGRGHAAMHILLSPEDPAEAYVLGEACGTPPSSGSSEMQWGVVVAFLRRPERTAGEGVTELGSFTPTGRWSLRY